MQYNSCTYVYTFRMYTIVYTHVCSHAQTHAHITHSLTHIHTCTLPHTDTHRCTLVNTQALVQTFTFTSYTFEIIVTQENPMKTPEKVPPIFQSMKSMMDTILRFNVHDGAGAQRISQKWKRDDFRKFSEMLRKPEKLKWQKGNNFPMSQLPSQGR